jgi:hypothetical protein
VPHHVQAVRGCNLVPGWHDPFNHTLKDDLRNHQQTANDRRCSRPDRDHFKARMVDQDVH